MAEATVPILTQQTTSTETRFGGFFVYGAPMKAILNQLFTGADNKTHDIGRWLAALTGVSGIFFQGYAVIVSHSPFSMQEFGVGAGALAAGIGAMLKLKEDTEPKDAESA